MNRIPLLFLIALLLAAPPEFARAADRPNIIVILADDMGFSDIGCYGGEIRTPNLDRLAANGVRMTQFYNTSRCCPTRASLLTGLYPHQAGVGWMMSDLGHPGYRGDLNRNCVTMAEVLRTAGYGTYMAGKWHVTPQVKPGSSTHNWPLQRGFDRFYGTIHGAGSFYDPNSLTRDNTLISPYTDPEYKPEQYYYTDAISDHTIRYINEHCQSGSTRDTPFFIYVAFTAAHWPMHALPRDIAKYKGQYDHGYGPIRAARLKKARELGLIDPNCKLSPQAEDWEANPHKEWEAACMEVYAAMVDRMDQGVGRIIDALKQNRQLDNTLLLYLQDNGGCAEGLGRQIKGPNNGQRADHPALQPMAADALQLDMIPKQTRDGWPILMGSSVMPGPADTYIAYGRGWANVSNTPFREYKHWVHEGGISTPLIAHWPKGIPASQNGRLIRTPGHLIDVMATCVDVSGASYPKTFHKENLPITPLEGRSLAPLFRGQTIRRNGLYWEHEGNVAVRVGNWKAVAKYPGYKKDQWELYDLQTDRTELNNLAAQMPDKLESLKTQWKVFAEKAHFLPVYGGRGAESARSTPLSKQIRFTLKSGADLPREQAPDITDRPFNVRARLSATGEGVIAAQGGTAHGWSLFVQDAKLHFATRNHGDLRVVSGPTALPENAATVEAVLAANGTVTLAVNGKTIASGPTSGPIKTQPTDGLQVGRDTGGAVARYATPFAFTGTIDAVQLNLQ